jgi:hypothetical protein
MRTTIFWERKFMTLSIKSIKQSAAIAAIVGAFALSLSSAVGAADWIQGNINMFGYGGDRYEVAQSKNLENVYRTFQIADAKDYLIPCRSGGRVCQGYFLRGTFLC